MKAFISIYQGCYRGTGYTGAGVGGGVGVGVGDQTDVEKKTYVLNK